MAADDYIPCDLADGIAEYYAYWDGEYAKPHAWRLVLSRRNMEQTDKALLVTLEDGTQMWVPKSICQSWGIRKLTVHIEHYDKLLDEHNALSDLLPDLPDEEEPE